MVRPPSLLPIHCICNKDTLCQGIQSMKEGKDQESLQSRTTPDPGQRMGK